MKTCSSPCTVNLDCMGAEEVEAKLAMGGMHEHMGCRSGQNYAFTLLSNLAVRLFTLVSGTLQLVSGTV